jgi:hypothetical protein
MTPGARATSRRISAAALACALAAFLLTLAFASPAGAVAADGRSSSHSAVAIHVQTHIAHRSDLPDLLAPAPTTDVSPAIPSTSTAQSQTDSGSTARSVRTRGPPTRG